MPREAVGRVKGMTAGSVGPKGGGTGGHSLRGKLERSISISERKTSHSPLSS